ncbi:MAG: metallophosphoesterase [Rubricoccaceae bacterium]|nr:metallophosphoesterase [Rubricoccaceae bacterium]
MRRLLPIALAAAAGALAYARFVEPRWLARTYTRVPIAGLPEALDGLRIAHLSDLHVTNHSDLLLLRRACRLAMAARPHLVALTGDFVSDQHGYSLGTVMATLSEELDAPLGLFAVPGNHEWATGIARYRRALATRPRLHDLTNAAARRTLQGATLRIAGTDSLREGDARPAEALADAAPADLTLLLSHNPDVAEDACAALGPVDLVLSGHTHGGQVRIPLWGAIVNTSRYPRRYEAGLVWRPWAWVYVSRGVGTVGRRLRFLCRPEVAILETTRPPPLPC